MLLKSITLENIRSYSSEIIEFPAGSVLLAGDIGTGKSTILLAIEFALFGLKSGELSGSSLLRYGATKGFVELTFNLDGKEISIKRTLKKSKDKIGQSAGYIITNGIKSDLMPTELRARIFALLNYPKSLVSKSQDLIYRFTVYTPQEEMRKIIYEDKDTRLDTLRKVFNIDRYKRIRENSLLYVKSLRTTKANLEGQIVDLDILKREFESLNKDITGLNEKEKVASLDFVRANKKTSEKKKQLEELEEKSVRLTSLKKEKAVLDADLRNTLERRQKDKDEIDSLQTAILQLRDTVKDFNEEVDLETLKSDKERRLDTLDKELIMLREKKSELKGKYSHLLENSQKVSALEECPMCKQDVPHEHKNEIMEKTKKNLDSIKENHSSLAKEEKDLTANFESLKKTIKDMHEKILNSQKLKLKKIALLEKEDLLHKLKENFSELKLKIGQINSKKIDNQKLILDFVGIEDDLLKLKKDFEALLHEERQKELEKNSTLKELESLQNQSKKLKEDILRKELLSKQLKKLISSKDWLEQKFIPLVASIEKHVMLTVYSEFNSLLQQWFNILIEDENLNIRLDDSFSVIVEQNGYEASISNLSGGEKTSVALAYRLALNKTPRIGKNR